MKHLNSLRMGELIPAKPAVPSKRHTRPDNWILVKGGKEEQRRKSTKNLGKEKMVTDKQTNGENFLIYVDSTPSVKGVK